MRALHGISQAWEILAAARDLTRQTRQFEWTIAAGTSFFLDAEYAKIDLMRADEDTIHAEMNLRSARSWALATDQDEAGVYIVLKRKPLIGSFGGARIRVSVPAGVHVSLKLMRCELRCHDISEMLELPGAAHHTLATKAPPDFPLT